MANKKCYFSSKIGCWFSCWKESQFWKKTMEIVDVLVEKLQQRQTQGIVENLACEAKNLGNLRGFRTCVFVRFAYFSFFLSFSDAKQKRKNSSNNSCCDNDDFPVRIRFLGLGGEALHPFQGDLRFHVFSFFVLSSFLPNISHCWH